VTKNKTKKYIPIAPEVLEHISRKFNVKIGTELKMRLERIKREKEVKKQDGRTKTKDMG
jgi:hypothetical protein